MSSALEDIIFSQGLEQPPLAPPRLTPSERTERDSLGWLSLGGASLGGAMRQAARHLRSSRPAEGTQPPECIDLMRGKKFAFPLNFFTSFDVI
jgi:hypothetical protein